MILEISIDYFAIAEEFLREEIGSPKMSLWYFGGMVVILDIADKFLFLAAEERPLSEMLDFMSPALSL